ncbi:MAG: DHHA1 domain-containing protein, partial [Cyclobacteriaceae bacterium]|nr:DHHA1 domain-containing protein [Cyclobacteriaceae bacterium]
RLNKTNAERRTFDQSITREALAMIEENPSLREAKTTVLFHKDWHKGIVGIVASRCTEHYYRPTIILTESNQKATGSARSVEGFDIYEAISACSDLIEQFGGHTHAAGLTLPLENVEPFKRKFEEVVSQSITQSQLLPVLEIDLTVDFDFVQYKSFNILKQMAPFGPHNQQPIFESENVYCKYAPKILKEEHLKMTLHQKGGPSFEAIAFGMAHLAPRIDTVTPFRIAYHIDENEYMGNKSLQLTLKDIKFYH